VQQNKSVSSGKSNSTAKVTELDDSDPPVVDPLESRGSRTTNSKKPLDLNDAEDTKNHNHLHAAIKFLITPKNLLNLQIQKKVLLILMMMNQLK